MFSSLLLTVPHYSSCGSAGVISRERLGDHRHHTVSGIDSVPARLKFTIRVYSIIMWTEHIICNLRHFGYWKERSISNPFFAVESGTRLSRPERLIREVRGHLRCFFKPRTASRLLLASCIVPGEQFSARVLTHRCSSDRPLSALRGGPLAPVPSRDLCTRDRWLSHGHLLRPGISRCHVPSLDTAFRVRYRHRDTIALKTSPSSLLEGAPVPQWGAFRARFRLGACLIWCCGLSCLTGVDARPKIDRENGQQSLWNASKQRWPRCTLARAAQGGSSRTNGDRQRYGYGSGCRWAVLQTELYSSLGNIGTHCCVCARMFSCEFSSFLSYLSLFPCVLRYKYLLLRVAR